VSPATRWNTAWRAAGSARSAAIDSNRQRGVSPASAARLYSIIAGRSTSIQRSSACRPMRQGRASRPAARFTTVSACCSRIRRVSIASIATVRTTIGHEPFVPPPMCRSTCSPRSPARRRA